MNSKAMEKICVYGTSPWRQSNLHSGAVVIHTLHWVISLEWASSMMMWTLKVMNSITDNDYNEDGDDVEDKESGMILHNPVHRAVNHPACDYSSTPPVKSGRALHLHCELRDVLTKQNCCSFGFCPNEGRGGPCPNFLSPFHMCIFG